MVGNDGGGATSLRRRWFNQGSEGQERAGEVKNGGGSF